MAQSTPESRQEQLRRVISSLWPDGREEHLTDEDLQRVADTLRSHPEEMLSCSMRELSSHLMQCGKCQERLLDMAEEQNRRADSSTERQSIE